MRNCRVTWPNAVEQRSASPSSQRINSSIAVPKTSRSRLGYLHLSLRMRQVPRTPGTNPAPARFVTNHPLTDRLQRPLHRQDPRYHDHANDKGEDGERHAKPYEVSERIVPWTNHQGV